MLTPASSRGVMLFSFDSLKSRLGLEFNLFHLKVLAHDRSSSL